MTTELKSNNLPLEQRKSVMPIDVGNSVFYNFLNEETLNLKYHDSLGNDW